jgi:hypothetical protein
MASRCERANMPLSRLGKDLLKDESGGIPAPKNPVNQPPLKRIHPDTTYETDAEAKASLEYWRTQPTEKIVESLRPGSKEPLFVKPDGRMMNGNTRTKVLEERGFDINTLPREELPPDPLLDF